MDFCAFFMPKLRDRHKKFVGTVHSFCLNEMHKFTVNSFRCEAVNFGIVRLTFHYFKVGRSEQADIGLSPIYNLYTTDNE